MSEAQVLSLLLFVIGIVCYAGLTCHYIRLKDGAAKIGLVGLVVAILLGQAGNLAILLARYCWPGAIETIRLWLLVPEIVTVASGVWLLSVAILQALAARRMRASAISRALLRMDNEGAEPTRAPENAVHYEHQGRMLTVMRDGKATRYWRLPAWLPLAAAGDADIGE